MSTGRYPAAFAAALLAITAAAVAGCSSSPASSSSPPSATSSATASTSASATVSANTGSVTPATVTNVTLGYVPYSDEKAGIDPASIHQIAIPFPQMPAALAQGRVQAAVIVAPFEATALAEGATVLTHPDVDLFPNGTVTCLDAMGSYISANPTVVSEFRAAMDESIAFSQAHESVVKQTLAAHLNLPMAVAEKQILATNWNPALNPASITLIEGYMKQFGIITSAPPAASMIWNPGQ